MQIIGMSQLLAPEAPIIGTSMNAHWSENIQEIATCSLKELVQHVCVYRLGIGDLQVATIASNQLSTQW